MEEQEEEEEVNENNEGDDDSDDDDEEEEEEEEVADLAGVRVGSDRLFNEGNGHLEDINSTVIVT